MLPRVVDRYELLSVLGSGGFATVYRARHVHTQQLVALKLLTSVPSIDKWVGEARAAAAVQHRNVVRVLDCGRAGDDVFIVMELADGPTLADVIAQSGTLPVKRAVAITLQLLDGLSVAHARGIVHRDVKPANVLLCRDEQGGDLPKLLDFGVSKQLTAISGTLDGTAIGTPGYMAPELFGGAKYADPRADVYAVAATLYEMLSGKLPFGATTYEEMVVQVATQRPQPLLAVAPNVPHAVAAAVDRGLAREREIRWASSEDFAAALRGSPLATAPGFDATLDARHAPPSPYVPTVAVTDPSTLRTAPPPVVSTANRHEAQSRSVLLWVIGLIGVTLVMSAFGGLVVWGVLRARALAPVAPIAPIAPVVTATAAPRATDTPQPRALATAAAGVVGGVKFKFPAQIVGQARATAIDALAQRIVGQAQRCRPEHDHPPVIARVQLFVQAEGTISIAKAASEPGDADAAECLATLFKEAATPQTFSPGGGGIATVEAKLDPR